MRAALARVAGAPGLILLVVVVHLLLAATIGSATRSAIGRSMEPFALTDNGQLWYAVLELLGTSPGLLAPIRHLVAGSAVIALAFWILAAAAVIHRLHGPIPLPRLAAVAVRGLPGILAVTLWHLVPRVVLFGVLGALTSALLGVGPWGLVSILILPVALAFCTCALDLARCDVVLRGARRFHPKTAWRGYLQAGRRPAVLIRSMLLSFGQWACAGAVLLAAFAGLHGGPAIWLARGCAILGIVLGLTRIAIAVGAGPYQRAKESRHPPGGR